MASTIKDYCGCPHITNKRFQESDLSVQLPVTSAIKFMEYHSNGRDNCRSMKVNTYAYATYTYTESASDYTNKGTDATKHIILKPLQI